MVLYCAAGIGEIVLALGLGLNHRGRREARTKGDQEREQIEPE